MYENNRLYKMDLILKLPEDIQRYIYEFDPTYKIKHSFENRRNNVHIIKELNNFKSDNNKLWDNITQHNKNIIKRKNYRYII